jgi:hypothetical protein
MKTKLTVSVDRDLLPQAKRSARRRGVSLSSIVERALTQLTQEDGASFSEKWRGRFRIREDVVDEPRGRELAAKYLGDARG